MSVNYKSYEFRVYEHISQLDNLLHTGDSSGELKQLQSEITKLRQDFEARHFRVAVVGEFNRGKTTFVNALLGKEILPADYLPTTAAINRITYSDEPNAYVVMKNGQKQSVQIAELAEYITKLTTSATEKAAQIHEAVVEYPSLFCRNGVDLIDTPGMNDEDDMNQVTISRLEGIDLAIVAVDSSMPFSMTECSFTVQLLESSQVCQIIIVATKIDMIPKRERQKLIDYMVERVREDVKNRLAKVYDPDHEVMKKYHAIFDAPCVFAVSAADALDALLCNDMELFEKSGFLRLNNELPEIIMKSQNNSLIMNTEQTLCGFIRKYREWLNENQLTAPKLNEMKTSFAQISYETVSKVLVLSNGEASHFLPNADEELAFIRKNFIQALGEMKTLSYEELKKSFFPIIKNLFQVLNQRYHSAEKNYLDSYRINILKPIGEDLIRKLEALLEPFPKLYKDIKPELARIPDYFELKGADQNIEDFYWVRSPLPDEGSIGADWNIMVFVDQAIRESLADYQYRRWQQAVKLFEQSKTQLDEKIQNLVRDVYDKTDRYMKQLEKEKEERQSILNRLSQLENGSRELRESFMAEAG
ncbi:MAG: dynamin family protein [Lachnospiraceae bacterium]|nr:dynamin family protein [Lachnospiraceae bacterium]